MEVELIVRMRTESYQWVTLSVHGIQIGLNPNYPNEPQSNGILFICSVSAMGQDNVSMKLNLLGLVNNEEIAEWQYLYEIAVSRDSPFAAVGFVIQYWFPDPARCAATLNWAAFTHD